MYVRMLGFVLQDHCSIIGFTVKILKGAPLHKKSKKWTQYVQKAVNDVIAGRKDFRAACTYYHISNSRLAKGIAGRKNGTSEWSSENIGKTTALSPTLEEELAELLQIMVRDGFPPLHAEMAGIHHEKMKSSWDKVKNLTCLFFTPGCLFFTPNKG